MGENVLEVPRGGGGGGGGGGYDVTNGLDTVVEKTSRASFKILLAGISNSAERMATIVCG